MISINELPIPFAIFSQFRKISKSRRRELFLLSLCLLFAACQSKPAPQGKRYELKGVVVSVDKAKQLAVIEHEEIRDYMEAMTMSYTIKDTWALDVMKPGDEVQASLVVTDDTAWLEEVRVIQRSSPTAAPAVENSSLPNPGDAVPDFKLVNQDGKTVRLSQYRGKVLLLTFIYTRCPVPEYCSLMSENFSTIDRELQKDAELYKKTHLLSISFDPAYDTPKVLRSYGASQTGNYDKETFSHWEFTTGEADEVKKMAQFFGISYLPDKDQYVHSLQTALIKPDGKIARLYTGNEWKPMAVVGDIRTLLAGNSR